MCPREGGLVGRLVIEGVGNYISKHWCLGVMDSARGSRLILGVLHPHANSTIDLH